MCIALLEKGGLLLEKISEKCSAAEHDGQNKPSQQLLHSLLPNE